jgi:RNA polymerase sigma factor (sigma-70 family)
LESLREQFFAKLDEPMAPPRERWYEMWCLIVSNAWYQAELEKCAKLVVHRRRVPDKSAEEIQQNAIVALAERLGDTVDLHVNRAKANRHFSGWLATIIRHDCQNELRKIVRRARKMFELDDRSVARLTTHMRPVEEIDVADAVDSLAEPIRTVIRLYALGWHMPEIATKLGMSRWAVRQAISAGIDRLEATVARGRN